MSEIAFLFLKGMIILKLLVAPDSFKGTLSAVQAATIISEAFRKVLPIESAVLLPLGDGGEGTAEALIAAGGQAVICPTTDGYGEPVDVRYCILNQTAIIDSASVVPMHAKQRRPEIASTYGLGAPILDALRRGCRRILLGLGGTGSNDGGCGLAAALGVRFFDSDGVAFVPCGETLGQIQSYDTAGAEAILHGISIQGLCDVKNPFFGASGAAHVFAPQKGAAPETVRLLDQGMEALAGVIVRTSGMNLQLLPGSGAAGGLGGGIAAWLNGTLTSGIQAVLELLSFRTRAAEADLIITGEGCSDEQTLMGKAVSGVLQAAGSTPVLVLSGMVRAVDEALRAHGAAAVCGVNRVEADFQSVARTAAAVLADEAANAARLLALGQKLGSEGRLCSTDSVDS